MKRIDFQDAIKYYKDIWDDEFLTEIITSTNNFSKLTKEEKAVQRKRDLITMYINILQWIEGNLLHFKSNFFICTSKRSPFSKVEIHSKLESKQKINSIKT